MMRRIDAMRPLVLACLIGVQLTGVAAAQSLGDVARQEEARRKNVKPAAKVYTNDTLPPSDRPAPASPAPAADGAAPGQPATPAAAADPKAAEAPATSAPDGKSDAAPAGPRDEKYWRGRVEAARAAVTRAQTFQDALQTRINALATDFVNRDDPAQRNAIAGERQKALAELDRVKKEIADGQKAIAAVQEEARRANVPAGWVR
jgi:hypothetical protein